MVSSRHHHGRTPPPSSSSQHAKVRARYSRKNSSPGHVDVQALVLFALVVAAVCALVGSVLLQTWSAAETDALERKHMVSTLFKDGAFGTPRRGGKAKKIASVVNSNHVRRDQNQAKKESFSSSTLSSGLDAHDEKQVAAYMKYWKLDPLVDTGVHRLPVNDKYVIFKTDCGGFNNIRMVFEYAVVLAWVTRRTLVLPPPAGWYLIDYGPQTRMKRNSGEEKVTKYSEFFDMEHLKAAVPIMTTAEMIAAEAERAGELPAHLVTADMKSSRGRETWKSWIKSKDPSFAVLPWSPLSKVIYWPSIAAVEKSMKELPGHKLPRNFVHHRTPVELTTEMRDKRFLSLPSCKDNDQFRYLGQVASMIAFSNEALSRSYKRMLRDHVHFPPIVFEIAAKVIAFLGLHGYSGLHVRRNELQYKEVFMGADRLLRHIRPLVNAGETLYIATDESDPNFFKAIEKEHKVFKWHDFFTAKGGNVLTGVDIPRKLEGCIEQVICSGARFFAGTLESTFTSYIFRIRGYTKAPNTEVYFHTLAYTGDVEADRKTTWSRKPIKGQIYKSEDPSMWLAPESPSTGWN